jgi:hypothetical protein
MRGPLAHAACTALGVPIGGAVGGFLSRRFSDQSQRLSEALRKWLVHDSGRIVGWTFAGNLIYAHLPP